ncbi:MAG: autotransporter domain-containing protein [Thermoguttaceae bacterium]|nr:autotransporter domain-containing protein [Thermoguttaceae bacterium]
MTQFPLRQLWRLLATIAAAAPLALIPAFAFGEDVPTTIDGLTLSTDPGSKTYTFVPRLGSTPPSGPVKIDLKNKSELDISAAFIVDNLTANIYIINGSEDKTATLKGTSIAIHDGNELTIGNSSADSTDFGTINVNSNISGDVENTVLTINRGSKTAETVLNGNNSNFSGSVNVKKGILTINEVDPSNDGYAINSNNAITIEENGTLKIGTASTATVRYVTNNGTIDLNNKKLIITEIGTVLGNVSNGQLEFDSAGEFILDNSGTLKNVDIALNDTIMKVNNGIKSAGNVNISTSDSGEIKLNNATNIKGDGTLTIDDINLNSQALSIESNSSNLYTVKFTNFSNPGGKITINSNTKLQLGTDLVTNDLVTNSDLHGYNGGTLQGNLIQSGSGKTYIEGGSFKINGDAKYNSGSGIVIQGSNSTSDPDLIVNGKLIFNTDASVTLSGSRNITLQATDGIYSYENSSESELTNNLAWKPNNETGTEYIVYGSSSEQQQDYFKILLDSNAYDIKDLTYNNRLLNITLEDRSVTDNPIEQIIVNAANAGNGAMADLHNKINNADCGRDAALNQLNPYTVSATTANQMWISQEYVSRTFQRMKMVRMAAFGYDNFVPMAPFGYANNVDDPETAYLGQSYGYPEYGYGYDYGYGYGAPCGWRPGYCGVLGNQWWFRGIGAWERQEAEGNLARYDTDYSGFTIGFDRLYGPGMLFGMSAGGVWNTTKFKDAGGSVAKGGTFLLDLYGSYFNNCSHFDYMFGYQGGTTDTTRRTDFGVDPSFGKIKSNTFIAAMELGRTFRFLRNTLEPYYDLQYINIQNDAFTEYGYAFTEYDSEAALDVYKNNQHALLQTIGIRYMGSCAGPLKGYYFVPQVEVGWVHNYSNTDIVSVASFANAVEAGSFVTSGYHVPRDRVKVAVGLDIVFNPYAKIDIKYECQAGDGFGFHTLTGGFDWNF